MACVKLVWGRNPFNCHLVCGVVDHKEAVGTISIIRDLIVSMFCDVRAPPATMVTIVCATVR